MRVCVCVCVCVYSRLVVLTTRDDFLGIYDKKKRQCGFFSVWLLGYGCFVIVVNALLLIALRKSHYATLNQMEQELSAEAATRKSQLALFTTERQRESRPGVVFSKTFLKHKSVQTEEISWR